MFVWPTASGLSEPGKVECTGSLGPGGVWYFTQDQLPTWATSAIVYSVPITQTCDFTSSSFPPAPGSPLGTGQPLVGAVVRSGPGIPDPIDVNSGYEAMTGADLGWRDPVSGSYEYEASPIYAAFLGQTSWLHIQNVGEQPASVQLHFLSAGRMSVRLDL